MMFVNCFPRSLVCNIAPLLSIVSCQQAVFTFWAKTSPSATLTISLCKYWTFTIFRASWPSSFTWICVHITILIIITRPRPGQSRTTVDRRNGSVITGKLLTPQRESYCRFWINHFCDLQTDIHSNLPTFQPTNFPTFQTETIFVNIVITTTIIPLILITWWSSSSISSWWTATLPPSRGRTIKSCSFLCFTGGSID